MIGILLAGGKGTRLSPLTKSVSKQLLPIFDKPMIYYPLTTLMLAGVRKILIVVDPSSKELYRKLLGDGSQWGLEFDYILQDEPKGIAHSLTLVPSDERNQSCLLVLGDNFFYGAGMGIALKEIFKNEEGALVFSKRVSNPEEFGVIELDSKGMPLEIHEKPKENFGNLAIPGVYFFDSNCYSLAEKLIPSARGEFEITDLLRLYLKSDLLKVKELSRGTTWLDTGNAANLLAASNFVYALEENQGLKIGSPEEVAYISGSISLDKFKEIVFDLPESEYKKYLTKLNQNPN